MRPGLLRSAYLLARAAGVDARATLLAPRNLAWFVRDLRAFRAAQAVDASFPMGALYPCLDDKQAASGEASGHYFHQDLLVARRIFARNPKRHVDVGSRIDGFVAHVATFRTIEVLDIRPLRDQIPNVTFRQVDLMAPGIEYTAVADSVSCLHALEHFGLGRYGDPINPDGHLAGLRALRELLRPAGMLYLSVPMGPQRIEFNAHRVFALQYLLNCVQADFDVEAFSYVDDVGTLHENVALASAPADVAASFGCNYGLAILELSRRT